MVIGYKSFIGFSICSAHSPKKIRTEQFVCSRADLLDFGVIHACEWSLKNPTNNFIYGFQGVFIANVFSVQAVHIEKKNRIELNVKHTPKTALTLVALARDVLLPSSVNAQIWQSNYSNYLRRANK